MKQNNLIRSQYLELASCKLCHANDAQFVYDFLQESFALLHKKMKMIQKARRKPISDQISEVSMAIFTGIPGIGDKRTFSSCWKSKFNNQTVLKYTICIKWCETNRWFKENGALLPIQVIDLPHLMIYVSRVTIKDIVHKSWLNSLPSFVRCNLIKL